MLVNIQDKLYREVKTFIRGKEIEYPTLKNFVEKAVRNELNQQKQNGGNQNGRS